MSSRCLFDKCLDCFEQLTGIGNSPCFMLAIMSLSWSFYHGVLSPFRLVFGLIKLISLVSSQECQDWWAAGCRQNTSTLPANCTACSTVKSLQIVTDIGELSEKLQGSQPFLTKVIPGFVIHN